MSSDQRLLRAVAAHFVMGAMLGALFVAVILLTDICSIGTAIAGAYLPQTTLVIFCIGPVLYFAFGAAITGFMFLVSDGAPDEHDLA